MDAQSKEEVDAMAKTVKNAGGNLYAAQVKKMVGCYFWFFRH
ncbi:MAG: hypothetical protein TRG1_3457 [Flavobacteriaceae bacterium FS1-H7996/R]|nr:MAG: hypothetical protein TRG1_3457 [Flavobacteriaceae bacterium FS1-H7996/R]